MSLEDRLCILIQMLLMFVSNYNIKFSAVLNNESQAKKYTLWSKA